MRSLGLPLLLAAACGYSAGSDHGQTPLADGRLPTVAVLPFDNHTFRRGLEMGLSRAVADEVRSRSPESPEAPGRADWLISGTITRAFERVLSEDTDDSVRQSSFWMTCDVVLRDRATDRIIETYSFTKSQPYSGKAGRFRTLQQAEREVIREIAEATVYWLESIEDRPQS